MNSGRVNPTDGNDFSASLTILTSNPVEELFSRIYREEEIDGGTNREKRPGEIFSRCFHPR